MKKLLLATLLISIFCLSGCANNGSPSENKSEPTSKEIADDQLNIEDFSWEIKPGKNSGKDYLAFKFTNNSDYRVISSELEYTLKNDADVNKVKEIFEEDFTDADDYKIVAVAEKDTKSSETVEGMVKAEIYYFSVDTMDVMDYYEENELRLGYVGSDNRIHVGYFDLKNKTFTNDDAVKEKLQNSDGEWTQDLPLPDTEFRVVSMEGDDYVTYNVFYMTKDEYDNYVDKLQNEFEYNSMVDKNDTHFEGKGKGGIEVSVYYEDSGIITLKFEK